MRILSIETSCDDTGISILEIRGAKAPSFKVLSNIVSSQEIHKKYGGVFPMMAKREHQKNLIPTMKEALKESKLLKIKKQKTQKVDGHLFFDVKKILKKEDALFLFVKEFLEKYEKPKINLIAVTNGPGLEPCLWAGVNFAKAISFFWNIPIVPVNHIEAHILVNFLNHKSYIVNPKETFPIISLVVSGGHTQLILMKGIGKYKIIGETRDDAAGECFDKAAKILGLGYPGGPIISKLAKNRDPISIFKNRDRVSIKLPRPMINTKDYDFSFSGLKTAVLYSYQKSKIKNQKYIQQMCFEVQQAIIDILIKKTIKAAKNYKVKTIILGGGVSANKELRKQLKEKIQKDIPNTKCLIPDTALSTDNALMIAVVGYFNRTKKIAWQKLSVNANLRV